MGKTPLAITFMRAIITFHPVQLWKKLTQSCQADPAFRESISQNQKLRGGGNTAHVNAADLRDTKQLIWELKCIVSYNGPGDWSQVRRTLGKFFQTDSPLTRRHQPPSSHTLNTWSSYVRFVKWAFGHIRCRDYPEGIAVWCNFSIPSARGFIRHLDLYLRVELTSFIYSVSFWSISRLVSTVYTVQYNVRLKNQPGQFQQK